MNISDSVILFKMVTIVDDISFAIRIIYKSEKESKETILRNLFNINILRPLLDYSSIGSFF